MKKSIYSVFAFAVFAASALSLSASELDVKVPFAFKAGSAVLPAGTYRVSETSPGVVLIRGEKGAVFVPKTAFLPEENEAGKASLTFQRAGDKVELRAVKGEK